MCSISLIEGTCMIHFEIDTYSLPVHYVEKHISHLPYKGVHEQYNSISI